MKEEYLHYLWRMKRLNLNNLSLVNGSKSPIQVKEIGWYNADSGPDFFNGSVVIDGIQWSGNIEIHLKSSDWYAHKHQYDKAYDNVILHVVYEHDKEVFINGNPIPTIELKNQIDLKHWNEYHKIISDSHKIPCHQEVIHHELALLQQIDLSFLHRIERKGLELLEDLKPNERDRNKLFLIAIFKSVGGRVNALPMQELAKLLPYNMIAKEKWDAIRIEALLFGCAGFLNENISESYYTQLANQWVILKRKYQLEEMNMSSWKFGGIRPFSFPTLLIAQLAVLLLQLESLSTEMLEAKAIQSKIVSLENAFIHPYWETHFRFGQIAKKREVKFSNQFKENLLINGIVPYFVALKHLTNEFSFIDRSVELMEMLPPENNAVMRYWKEIGFKPKNALESQGLLELNNEFCTFRKCLSCKVGAAILEK